MMPVDISLISILIWLAVGFFVGLGWFTAAWVTSKVLR